MQVYVCNICEMCVIVITSAFYKHSLIRKGFVPVRGLTHAGLLATSEPRAQVSFNKYALG